MMRAAVGSWVLVLVFSAFVVSSGLWGAAEPGLALRQAPPSPPAIGSCTIGLDAPRLVPCDTEHDGEVALSWTGDTPPGTLDPTRFDVPDNARDDPQLHCQQAAEDYIGVTGPVEFSPDIQWYPTSVQWQTAIGRGPVTRYVPEWSWSVCLIRSYGSDGLPLSLSRSVQDAGRAPSAELPASWRLCIRDSGYWFEWLPCTVPHRAEIVASVEIAVRDQADQRSLQEQQQNWTASGPVFGEMDPTAPLPERFRLDLPAAEQECRDLVTAYLGLPVDDRDDLLAVITYESLYYGDRAGVDPTVDLPVGVYGTCTVEVVGDRPLTGSVAGIGSGPLPFG